MFEVDSFPKSIVIKVGYEVTPRKICVVRELILQNVVVGQKIEDGVTGKYRFRSFVTCCQCVERIPMAANIIINKCFA